MARKPEMKICVDCRAPNPADRFICYRCNERLDKIPDGAPAPGERSYPCANCGARMTFDARSCPSCGRVPEVMASFSGNTMAPSPVTNRIEETNQTPYPVDWDVEPLPDGTFLLRRTIWGRARTDYPVAAMGLYLLPLVVGLPFTLIRLLTGRPGAMPDRSGNVLVAWLIIALVVASGLLAILWLACGKEEIRVGSNFLEVFRRLGPFGSRKRVDGMSVLRVAVYQSRDVETRRLVVENLGTSLNLDRTTRQDYSFLTGTIGGLGTSIADPVTCLGRFLAKHTGWPLVAPGEKPPF